MGFLFEKLPEVKKTKVRQWLKFEGVRVNGRVVVRGDRGVKAGDVVVLDPKSKPVAGPRLPSGRRIVHEDDALMLIEKPAHLLLIATNAAQDATVYPELLDSVMETPPGLSLIPI